MCTGEAYYARPAPLRGAQGAELLPAGMSTYLYNNGGLLGHISSPWSGA